MAIKMSLQVITLFGMACLAISCSFSTKNQEHKVAEQSNIVFNYEAQSLPAFLNEIYQNHKPQVKDSYLTYYQEFCQKHEVESSDSTNQAQFFQIIFMHLLFTSESASNGSQGGMLKIPYLWHWVQPNPRHDITWLATDKPLTETSPPAAFKRYQSFADIDRTPGLFLSDLFTEKPSYYHPVCDSFYTFGWCSEREMSFVLCLELLGYTGKTKSEGNHSWTCLWVEFVNTAGEKFPLEMQIDNTFHGISGLPVEDAYTSETWQKDVGEGRLPHWYNKMAHDQGERAKIKKMVISKSVANRIEKQVSAFFNP